jgi:hypothetical protein
MAGGPQHGLDALALAERLDELAMTERNIAQSEINITAQRDRVARSEKAGRDAALSRRPLATFEVSLGLRYAHRARVLRALNG